MSSEIENYTLTKKLGSGAYAEVWEANNVTTGEMVAVKIFEWKNDNNSSEEEEEGKGKERDERKRRSSVDYILKQNKNEIKCLQHLRDHENIVCLHDVVVGEEKVYLVQELAQKGDFFDFMFTKENLSRSNKRGEGLDEYLAQKYFSQLINAVHFMHKKGYAHRDIKIENCLVTKTGKLLLCDFGMVTRKRKCNNRCGTLDYLAPEVVVCEKLPQQQQAKKKKNKKKNNQSPEFSPFLADIWACGVFLFYILTFDLPFEDDTRELIEENILTASFSVPSFVSDNATDLILKMLQPDPSKRCTIDEVINHPFLTQKLIPKEQQKEQQQEGETSHLVSITSNLSHLDISRVNRLSNSAFQNA